MLLSRTQVTTCKICISQARQTRTGLVRIVISYYLEISIMISCSSTRDVDDLTCHSMNSHFLGRSRKQSSLQRRVFVLADQSHCSRFCSLSVIDARITCKYHQLSICRIPKSQQHVLNWHRLRIGRSQGSFYLNMCSVKANVIQHHPTSSNQSAPFQLFPCSWRLQMSWVERLPENTWAGKFKLTKSREIVRTDPLPAAMQLIEAMVLIC